jgi:hypothetical protein
MQWLQHRQLGKAPPAVATAGTGTDAAAAAAAAAFCCSYDNATQGQACQVAKCCQGMRSRSATGLLHLSANVCRCTS